MMFIPKQTEQDAYSENVPPLMMFIPGEMYPYAHVYSDNVHTDDIHAVVTKCT